MPPICFPLLLFVGLYEVTRSAIVSTVFALRRRRCPDGLAEAAAVHPIDAMQWMSLDSGGGIGRRLALPTDDPRFIMFKPTLIYTAVGVMMLRWPEWIVRYQPPVALRWGRDVAMRFGYIWAGLMFGTGALNLALVVHGDSETVGLVSWASSQSRPSWRFSPCSTPSPATSSFAACGQRAVHASACLAGSDGSFSAGKSEV